MENHAKSPLTLDDAVLIARELPDDAQLAIARGIVEHVADLTGVDRTPEREALIRDRVSRPFEVPRDDVLAILGQFDHTL
jgi:hypothetical protein